ncbi:MAG: DUF2208 family protein [Sulfolobales archaeon]|nr:DUF2208 domain-containing protein [Sulfolobales archaeon]MCX8186186.1 DUF2208 domain-containing protein [Sulfolobales archaeon]MDW7969481.1 DUF2208 family protein [Sulfolobales archaeon]
MSYVYSKKFMVFSQIYGQAIIFILAITNTYYPQYLNYTFLIFIISMFIMMYVTFRTSLKHVVGSESREIRGGRKLLEVKYDDVMSVVKYDAKLNEELKPMMKTTLLSLINTFIILAWYYIYFNVVIHSFEGADLTIKFFGFLLGYEIPYVAVTVVNLFTRKSVRYMIQVIRDFTIYDRGIVGSGVSIKFPLASNYEVKVEAGRKFVEIAKIDKNSIIRYRFYSKSYDRIADIVNKYGKPKSETK